MDLLPGQAERARSAISDLVGACRALPDFDTLQIVRFPISPPPLECFCPWPICDCPVFSMEGLEARTERLTKDLKRQMKDLEVWAMDCLEALNRRFREGGRREATLEVIQFREDYSYKG